MPPPAPQWDINVRGGAGGPSPDPFHSLQRRPPPRPPLSIPTAVFPPSPTPTAPSPFWGGGGGLWHTTPARLKAHCHPPGPPLSIGPGGGGALRGCVGGGGRFQLGEDGEGGGKAQWGGRGGALSWRAAAAQRARGGRSAALWPGGAPGGPGAAVSPRRPPRCPPPPPGTAPAAAPRRSPPPLPPPRLGGAKRGGGGRLGGSEGSRGDRMAVGRGNGVKGGRSGADVGHRGCVWGT